jgi:hypothetical protein
MRRRCRRDESLTVGGESPDRRVGQRWLELYLSSVDPRIRRAFSVARALVTNYSACDCAEYFAEAVRAFFEVNDAQSLWPNATRERLWSVDPRMAAIVASLFEYDLAEVTS